MGEIIGGIVQMFGVYVLYALGNLTLKVFTLGRYSAQPYEKVEGNAMGLGHTVTSAKTMLIGFFVLVLLVVLVSIPLI